METPVWSYTASNLGSNDTVTKCRLGRQQSAGSQDLTAFLSNFNRWFFQIVSNSLNKWTAIIWRHFSSNLLIFRTIRARTNHRTKLIGAAFDLLKTPPCSLSRKSAVDLHWRLFSWRHTEDVHTDTRCRENGNLQQRSLSAEEDSSWSSRWGSLHTEPKDPN